jgi:hypothetical protein
MLLAPFLLKYATTTTYLEIVQMKNQAENNPKWRKVKWSTSPEDSEEVILMLTRNHSYPIGIQ